MFNETDGKGKKRRDEFDEVSPQHIVEHCERTFGYHNVIKKRK
jgi:hypothetical protein